MKPISFRQAKKRLAQADKKARADENAVKHGRTKEQKAMDETAVTSMRHFVDKHKLDE